MNPLQQGLKPPSSVPSRIHSFACCNNESTTTRIETPLHEDAEMYVTGCNNESTTTRIETDVM